MGLLSRGSQVRALPGAPFLAVNQNDSLQAHSVGRNSAVLRAALVIGSTTCSRGLAKVICVDVHQSQGPSLRAASKCWRIRRDLAPHCTVMVTSSEADKPPSSAVARRTYVPGWLNVAFTRDMPSAGARAAAVRAKGCGCEGSKATRPPPRYTNHPIRSPTMARLALPPAQPVATHRR
jgi:hypothetical protein